MAGLHLVIAVAAFVAVAIANPSPLGFQVVDAVEKSCAKLEPVSIESAKFNYFVGTKKVGSRQLGDNKYNSGIGSCPEDYQTRFNYLSTGPVHPKISYVEITVTQNSAISNVYITAGGIGETVMSILVEAKNTTYLGAEAVFYGI